MSDAPDGRPEPADTAAGATGPDARQALATALERIRTRDPGRRFVLLRQTPLGIEAVDGGDVDLLCRRADVDALLQMLDPLCRELHLNLFVQRTGPRKTRVTLYSQDLLHALHLDLWTDLWQLADGRRSLRWRDVAARCAPDRCGFARMPPRLEAAVYVEHLRAKRKDLGSPGVRARLEHYASALAARRGEDAPAAALAALAADAPAALTGEVLSCAAQIIEEELGARHRWRAPMRRLEDALRRRLPRALAPPRVPAVALVGPDGIGKSTLGHTLAEADAGAREYVLGKSLYRRSLLFRGLYRLNRMTGARLSQERIDEALCALAYLTALVRLRRRLADAPSGGLVIDRYLADFLYVGRKTDRARFSRVAWIADLLYLPLPVVHLTAPHAVLATRKQEISAAGLARYDRHMTRFYARRPQVRYLRFENADSPEQAGRRLARYLAPVAPGAES